MFYVIGLGNPGDKYKNTRHNVGQRLVQYVHEHAGFADWSKDKHANALYAHGVIGNEGVELILPETFMNRSGETIRYVVKKHKAKPEEFIVVHDDIDLPLGEIRISVGRGDGGNNGVESVIKHLGSKDFIRIRVGIALRSFWTGEVMRPAGGGTLERYVLKPFSRKDAKKVDELAEKIPAMLETIVSQGAEAAMNQYN